MLGRIDLCKFLEIIANPFPILLIQAQNGIIPDSLL